MENGEPDVSDEARGRSEADIDAGTARSAIGKYQKRSATKRRCGGKQHFDKALDHEFDIRYGSSD
jgi:hypothetical protein